MEHIQDCSCIISILQSFKTHSYRAISKMTIQSTELVLLGVFNVFLQSQGRATQPGWHWSTSHFFNATLLSAIAALSPFYITTDTTCPVFIAVDITNLAIDKTARVFFTLPYQIQLFTTDRVFPHLFILVTNRFCRYRHFVTTIYTTDLVLYNYPKKQTTFCAAISSTTAEPCQQHKLVIRTIRSSQ